MSFIVCGLDFGTLGARCVLVDALTGKELSMAEHAYRHGVLEGAPGEAFQDPADYKEALSKVIREAVKRAGMDASEIRAVGLDFTACTILPVDEELTPLCFLPEFQENRQSFVKLWKHHGAEAEAEELSRLFGKRLSSELGLPKVLETFRKAPEVYERAATFMEAADWVASLLTGKEGHSAVFAGYKLLWDAEEGYPALPDGIERKLSQKIVKTGEVFGTVSREGALLSGLPEGIPVAPPMIDGHAGAAGTGMTRKNEMVLVLGTSGTQYLHSEEYHEVPGVFGCMKDGVIPGLYTYEAGQSAVGDMFDWFVKTIVPEGYVPEGTDVHRFLSEKAAALPPEKEDLIAVDWLNGCRTPLNDGNLRGGIYGLTLGTKPEEIYLALLKSAAMGTRRILENFEEHGVAVEKITACGGIALKNPLFVQLIADVCQRPIDVSAGKQCAALGSAVYAAVAGGAYRSIPESSLHMKSPVLYTAVPEREYGSQYRKYLKLSEVFRELGEEGNDGF